MRVTPLTGILMVLSFACGSKTASNAPADGAADVATATGGALGLDGPRGSGGLVAVGTGGTTGADAGNAVGSGGFVGAGGLVGSGGFVGTGGLVGSGGLLGTGGRPADAGLSADVPGPETRASLDGGVEAPRDTAIDGTTSSCEGLLGGICSGLVDGCATCPSGSFPYPSRSGCPDQTWCCTPTPSASDSCLDVGGVCVRGLDSYCPPGWGAVWTSCSDPSSKCCMPQTATCRHVPKKCAESGGVCTQARWTRCPLGTEPYSLSSNQLGCEAYANAWCCVEAPPSPCADEPGGGMCVPGAACTGCFAAHPDPAMTCESGRVCCVDMCD